APDATLTVRLGAADTWTIRLFKSREDTEALVSGRTGAFQLAGDAVARLHEAFKKAAGGK
ncbi:MAG: hypothetical protein M3S32_05430, partial [Acidobacteriota bacterium]|nr:hypothetical protein [Acidobacteriota bacterium]